MDGLGLELQLDRLEAVIAGAVEATTRALWRASGQHPWQAAVGDPPALTDDATRRTLHRARGLAGDPGRRAEQLWRLAVAAGFAAADPARGVPPDRRDEAGFGAAAAVRAQVAARLGFVDAWALARACAGEPDGEPAAAPVRGADPDRDDLADLEPRLGAILAEPAPLVARLAGAHGVDPAAITVAVSVAAAPVPGRTFVITPGRDVRIRVWSRPGASRRGAVRVLLHEVGHALLAGSWRALPWARAAPTSRAFDEGVAAWTASLLEREAFLTDALALPAADARRLAAAERRLRGARQARLVERAGDEHAFYRAGAAPPWRHPLAWTDPGASASYARAEAIRDDLDRRLGAGWPTASLEPLAASGAW